MYFVQNNHAFVNSAYNLQVFSGTGIHKDTALMVMYYTYHYMHFMSTQVTTWRTRVSSKAPDVSRATLGSCRVPAALTAITATQDR